jgi:Protein of unknown function (DUF2488)
MNINYHYLVMSQKDLLQNQVIEEILREKSSYYAVQNKIPDYWILISPNFLKKNELDQKIKLTKFFQNQKEKIVFNSKENKTIEFYASLVSLDKEFMNWVKLRLGYFEEIDTFQKERSIASYVSDGVCGTIEIKDKLQEQNSLLSNDSSLIHPDIICEKLLDSIKSFY